jgi:DNA-binding beta-propeller fold protein YncE
MRTATRARRAFWRRLPIVAVIAAASVLFATTLPAGGATSGTKLWAKRLDGQASGDDSAMDVAVSGDGTRVFVTGGSDGGFTGTDYVTRAYDATTGAKLWTTSYDGLAQFDDDAVALVVSPDDSTVFVTGDSSATTNANDYDYATIAYDAASGAELWAKRYDGPANSNDAPFAIAVSPDGQAVFVTGTSISATGSFDFATLAYATSTGARLWKTRYGGRWHGVDEAFGIVVSPDGSSVFVTGNSVSANSFDMETVAYDAATGATEWRGRL